MDICLVVEVNVFLKKRKEMNTHYHVTKPKLFKIKTVEPDKSN
jgi:hypothetical protein